MTIKSRKNINKSDVIHCSHGGGECEWFPL